MKSYIARREFKKHGGKTYPVGTEFICKEDWILNREDVAEEVARIYHPQDGLMCNRHSEKSFQCFVGNDDGKWKERGELIDKIENLVLCDDLEVRYNRIMCLWNDKLALSYSRGGDPDEDPWYWNDDFYCGDIEDLKYLLQILEEIK